MTVESPSVAALDGSRYPPEASWCADMLPPRVRGGERDRTVGYADYSFDQFSSGEDGTWTPYIRDRAIELGFRPTVAEFFSSHVEFKVASKMIMESKQRSELVINNVPCRSRGPLRPGCHETLPRYLPAGSSLTVYGSTEDGRPFTFTYKGQA